MVMVFRSVLPLSLASVITTTMLPLVVLLLIFRWFFRSLRDFRKVSSSSLQDGKAVSSFSLTTKSSLPSPTSSSVPRRSSRCLEPDLGLGLAHLIGHRGSHHCPCLYSPRLLLQHSLMSSRFTSEPRPVINKQCPWAASLPPWSQWPCLRLRPPLSFLPSLSPFFFFFSSHSLAFFRWNTFCSFRIRVLCPCTSWIRLPRTRVTGLHGANVRKTRALECLLVLLVKVVPHLDVDHGGLTSSA